MDPHRGLSLRGDATNALPLSEPEPEPEGHKATHSKVSVQRCRAEELVSL